MRPSRGQVIGALGAVALLAVELPRVRGHLDARDLLVPGEESMCHEPVRRIRRSSALRRSG
jgi:hypothetical protein